MNRWIPRSLLVLLLLAGMPHLQAHPVLLARIENPLDVTISVQSRQPGMGPQLVGPSESFEFEADPMNLAADGYLHDWQIPDGSGHAGASRSLRVSVQGESGLWWVTVSPGEGENPGRFVRGLATTAKPFECRFTDAFSGPAAEGDPRVSLPFTDGAEDDANDEVLGLSLASSIPGLESTVAMDTDSQGWGQNPSGGSMSDIPVVKQEPVDEGNAGAGSASGSRSSSAFASEAIDPNEVKFVRMIRVFRGEDFAILRGDADGSSYGASGAPASSSSSHSSIRDLTYDLKVVEPHPALGDEHTGLYAGENIPGNARLAVYTGKRYGNNELPAGFETSNLKEHQYFVSISASGQTADPEFLINGYEPVEGAQRCAATHSNTSEEKDTNAILVFDEAIKEIVLISTRPIQIGDEILTWYGPDYLEDLKARGIFRRLMAKGVEDRTRESKVGSGSGLGGKKRKLDSTEASAPPDQADKTNAAKKEKKAKNAKTSKESPKKAGEFKCQICGQEFGQFSDLTRHLDKNSSKGKFPCGLCPHQFRSIRSRASHRSSAHRDAPKSEYECEICKKQFRVPSLLAQHVNWNPSEGEFPCDRCPHQYPSESSMTIHRRYAHPDAPPLKPGELKCQICGREFGKPSLLNTHLNRNPSEGGFPCDRCPHQYPTEVSRSIHRRRTHPDAPPLGLAAEADAVDAKGDLGSDDVEMALEMKAELEDL